MGDRLLHHARALHDLRQEHLAGAEQVADDVHAVHQRAFDDLDGRSNAWRASSVSSTTKSAMPLTSAWVEPFATGASRHDRSATCSLPPCAVGSATGQQALGRVIAAIEDDVLDALAQILGMSS